MTEKFVLGKPISEWKQEYALLEELCDYKEIFWENPLYENVSKMPSNISLTESDVFDAIERLERFAPYIEKTFPETKANKGIIESSLVTIDNMKNAIEEQFNQRIKGNLLLKCDSNLPISGSIKARGGIYAVLKHAETLAIKDKLLSTSDNYEVLCEKRFKDYFSKHSISVGSTGNLGLSIGIMSAALGFKVTVHMSNDAKQWKKDLLRSKGAIVVEYDSDFSKAVEEGRKQANKEPLCFFIDDENSEDLFLGYAVAAYRLKKQLDDMNISVNENNPLFVYLPCGVGGGPGGVAFGLNLIFGKLVNCFFVEPTHSPSMLIGSLTGEHDKVCVQDFGIDNITAADGLAVGRPSAFVGKTVSGLLSGIYTVSDDLLYKLLAGMYDSESIKLEPSALAGVIGPTRLYGTTEGKAYLDKYNLSSKMETSTHIAWATGGSMVPESEMKNYYNMGKSIN